MFSHFSNSGRFRKAEECNMPVGRKEWGLEFRKLNLKHAVPQAKIREYIRNKRGKFFR
jgi:hypothetical protein